MERIPDSSLTPDASLLLILTVDFSFLNINVCFCHIKWLCNQQTAFIISRPCCLLITQTLPKIVSSSSLGHLSMLVVPYTACIHTLIETWGYNGL